MTPYVFDLVFYWALWSCAGIALHWSMHEAGLTLLASGVAFGVGAYATIAFESFTNSIWISLVLAALAAGLFMAAFYGTYVRALSDDFLVASLGLQFVMLEIFLNVRIVTGGPIGIANISPLPPLSGDLWPLQSVLLVVLLAAIVWGTSWLHHQPWRRDLNVLREDRLLAAFLAKPVLLRQAQLGALVGGSLGLLGALRTRHVGFAEASSFGFSTSVTVILVVLCSGTSRFGVLGGAAVVVLLPEFLRLLPIATADMAHVRQMLFGLLLVGLVVYQSQAQVDDFERANDVSL